MKWYDQWFDPCWLNPRLVPNHVRLHISIEWGLIVLCHNFAFEKSFISESQSDTIVLGPRNFIFSERRAHNDFFYEIIEINHFCKSHITKLGNSKTISHIFLWCLIDLSLLHKAYYDFWLRPQTGSDAFSRNRKLTMFKLVFERSTIKNLVGFYITVMSSVFIILIVKESRQTNFVGLSPYNMDHIIWTIYSISDYQTCKM